MDAALTETVREIKVLRARLWEWEQFESTGNWPSYYRAETRAEVVREDDA